jgi:phosphatidylserine/phosphatidylglycerophosphate/cardiolipin synthase-like enzyme
MKAGRQRLTEEIDRLADEMPRPMVEALAAVLEQSKRGTGAPARTTVLAAVPQPEYRALASRLLDVWAGHAPDVAPESLALALTTAACCAESARRRLSLELVWTGPDVEAVPPRRTDQALLQLINAATQTLTVVSFVAYKVPTVRDALIEAAKRKVAVRLILEEVELAAGRVAFDAIRALGVAVAASSTVYVWPLDQRLRDPAGRHGSLHAKCAVADRGCLLVSSANLTEHAFTLNLEIGLLVRGGRLPALVESYFEQLIRSRVLRPVSE